MYLFYWEAASNRSKNAASGVKWTWILRSVIYRLWKLRQTIYFLCTSVLLSVKYASWTPWIVRSFLSLSIAHAPINLDSLGSSIDVSATYGALSVDDVEEALRKVACVGSPQLRSSGICKIHKKFSEHSLKPFPTCIRFMAFSWYEGMKLIVCSRWFHYFPPQLRLSGYELWLRGDLKSQLYINGKKGWYNRLPRIQALVEKVIKETVCSDYNSLSAREYRQC